MSKMNEEATDRPVEYVKPTISDYGDLVEVTAAGRTGGRADAEFKHGDVVTFISSAP